MNESSHDEDSMEDYIEQTLAEYNQKAFIVCDILQEEMIKQALELFEKNPLVEGEEAI